MGRGVGNVGPWGDRPPRRPAVGAGRAALKKRAKAGGGGESASAAAAARRALGRVRGGRGARRDGGGRGRNGRSGAGAGLGAPMRGAAAGLMRWSRVFEQRFLLRQRLRTILIALAAVWIVWTFLLGDASLPRLWMVDHRNDRLVVEIEEMAAREARLKAEVVALESKRSAPEFERIAREEHALVRDGEVLVRFHESGRDSSGATGSPR